MQLIHTQRWQNARKNVLYSGKETNYLACYTKRTWLQNKQKLWRRLKALFYTVECRNICVSEHVNVTPHNMTPYNMTPYNMTPHNVVEVFRHFGVTFCLYFILKTEEVTFSETSVNLYYIVTYSVTHTTVIFTVTAVQTTNITCKKMIFIFMYISKRKLFRIYRVGHEKVTRLPFCTCPCYCINFCIYDMHPEGRPRKSSPDQ